MTQRERRIYLIRALLRENPQYRRIAIPKGEKEQKQLLRALFNVRLPGTASQEFLEIQDEYLRSENKAKGIVDYKSLTPIQDGIYLWQGDITRLNCGAIVNAANSALLGCFHPNHTCIDNCIHTYAGIQLRRDCAQIMERQGHKEETGKAKITLAYNLPSEFVIHTVGPIVSGLLTREHEQLLASCYRSCLELAEENGIQSIASCCISTGVFHFPNQRAAEIAVQTVQDFKQERGSHIEVIFNVFQDTDYEIYQKLLSADRASTH